MNHTEQRQKLRAIFAGNQCFSPATVYDALSARVAESVGFQIGMLAGSVASNTTLAAPDLILITLTEFADQVRDRKSTRLNSSHSQQSRMPSSA